MPCPVTGLAAGLLDAAFLEALLELPAALERMFLTFLFPEFLFVLAIYPT
jgi:F0F1-type ATP synthase membrane subunit c/vacuolar-type H+-ATPase subunit K